MWALLKAIFRRLVRLLRGDLPGSVDDWSARYDHIDDWIRFDAPRQGMIVPGHQPVAKDVDEHKGTDRSPVVRKMPAALSAPGDRLRDFAADLALKEPVPGQLGPDGWKTAIGVAGRNCDVLGGAGAVEGLPRHTVSDVDAAKAKKGAQAARSAIASVVPICEIQRGVRTAGTTRDAAKMNANRSVRPPWPEMPQRDHAPVSGLPLAGT